MVANVAVVTELERLAHRAKLDAQKRRELTKKTEALGAALHAAKAEHQRAVDALAVRRRRLDALVEKGRVDGKQLGGAAIEHQGALVRAERSELVFTRSQDSLKDNLERIAKLNAALERTAARCAKLEPRRTIRQLDVAQDTILTAAKLTASQLISFAAREYLPSMPMTPDVFVTRVFGLHGRKEIHPDEEHIILNENPRDPEVNAAVADACRRLNEREAPARRTPVALLGRGGALVVNAVTRKFGSTDHAVRVLAGRSPCPRSRTAVARTSDAVSRRLIFTSRSSSVRARRRQPGSRRRVYMTVQPPILAAGSKRTHPRRNDQSGCNRGKHGA